MELDREQLERIAQSHYSPLPYHNFEHAKRVAGEAENLASKFSAEVSPILPETFYVAGLFHDAGYIEDHTEKGFETKEEYAANIAGTELSQMGFEDILVRDVEKLILATEPDSDDVDFSSSLMRAVDFSSFASPSFLEDNKKVREEIETNLRERMEDKDFYERVKSTANKYLKRDEETANKVFGADFNWRERVEANLRELGFFLNV